MSGSDTAAGQLPWWHGVAILAAALALFLLLPQRLLHGADTNQFVVWIEEGDPTRYARHAAYLHFGSWIYAAVEPLGGGGHLALRIASAIGTALGLVFLHRSFALLLAPRAAMSTAAVLATPAWFYYATQAEIPGVFVAGVGATWWTFARWLDRATIGRAFAIGIAAAIAGALHSFGHLLTISFVLVALLLRAPRHVSHAGAMLGSHAVVALMLSLLLASDAAGQTTDAVGHLEERWRTFAPLTAPWVFWREWIVPFLPWSIGAFVALGASQSRRWAFATMAMLALHLPLNVLLLGFHGINEGGAYLVSLAPAAVIATALFVTARGFAIATVCGAVITVLAMAPGWRDPVPAGFGQGVRELDVEQKIALVVGTREELAGARAAVKDLMVMELNSVAGAYNQLPPAQRPPSFAQWFDGWFDSFAASGMATVFTDSARQLLDEDRFPISRSFWREHVPARYELVEVERASFRGVILRRR